MPLPEVHRQVVDWLRLEAAFHYLGSANFFSSFFLPGLPGVEAPSFNTEKSYALAGSVVFVSPPLASWSIPTSVPTYLLFRVGAAGKDINQTGAAGRKRMAFVSACRPRAAVQCWRGGAQKAANACQ